MAFPVSSSIGNGKLCGSPQSRTISAVGPAGPARSIISSKIDGNRLRSSKSVIRQATVPGSSPVFSSQFTTGNPANVSSAS